MSESQNVDEDTFSFQEIYEYETRNLAGCDNDDSCCTFPKGYVFRQALYHCITCKSITGKDGGICFPCSVHCHSGHVLEDLYTKRNFRCDCGNSNFPSNFSCNLWEEKDDLNLKNKYNHNFSGLYCVCNIEYDEGKDTEEMVQCIICEDWYHLKHLSDTELEIKSIDLDNFEEFICKMCLESREYLQIYNSANLNNVLNKYVAGGESPCNLVAASCAVNALTRRVEGFSCGAFWMSDWRQSLCRCESCEKMMEADDSRFLLDSRDGMGNYFSNSQADDEFKEEMSNLPYSQAIKLAEGIATFKREFTDFVSSMDPDKVVTVDDIHNFFDKIKRRRLERQE